MTPSEFKAWFEGFTESMDGPPSLKQWERIQACVKQITGTPTTYPVYVDRYVPATPRPWYHNSYGGVASLFINTTAAQAADLSQVRVGGTHLGANGHMAKFDEPSAAFDSHAAMNALGKADAVALAAA